MHLNAFQQFGVSPPSSDAFPGEAYLDPFIETARNWLERLLDMV